MHRGRPKGFTLLEAVIAIAIFSMGAIAIYSWVNANLITLSRVDHINTRSSAIQSALDFMSTVDSEKMPQGRVQLGGLRVDWVSHPAGYQSDVLDEQGYKTINQAALLVGKVSLYEHDELIHEFEMPLLSVKKVRDISDVIFD